MPRSLQQLLPVTSIGDGHVRLRCQCVPALIAVHACADGAAVQGGGARARDLRALRALPAQREGVGALRQVRGARRRAGARAPLLRARRRGAGRGRADGAGGLLGQGCEG